MHKNIGNVTDENIKFLQKELGIIKNSVVNVYSKSAILDKVFANVFRKNVDREDIRSKVRLKIIF